MLRFVLFLCSGLLIASAASSVWAQEAEPEQDLGAAGYEEPPMAGEPAGDGTGDAPLGDEQAIATEQMGVEEHRDSTDPWEDPQEGYYFVGLFYRHIFMPEFILNLFLEESTGTSNPAFGAEVTYRKDAFDIIGSLWWASYSVNGPFRGSGDPVGDTEWIDSELSVLYLSGTFLWSTPFNDVFALEYGVALGVGVVLGDLQRTEAYQRDGQWAACTDAGNPGDGAPGGGPYCDGPAIRDLCDGDGGHYCEEGKWSDGGSVPNVVPWFALPQIALRIKPIKQLMMRIEGGIGLGFFLGGAINYGF